MRFRKFLSAAALLCLVAGTAQAIQLGILDDFEGDMPMTCSTDGWTEGGVSANPPTAIVGCGEFESCCLVNESAGGFGAGSRQVTYNESQWAGDYIAAGVNKIQVQIANPGTTALNMRVGLTNTGAGRGVGLPTCYVSTNAISIAPAEPLTLHSFLLTDSEMTLVFGNQCGGSDSLATVLAGVTHLRLLSAVGTTWAGDAIESTVQFEAFQSKGDSDEDGVNDDLDNCTDVPNADQTDTDGDLYGNACDPDLNNDCVVNFSDLGIMKSVFFTPDADADLDGNGVVNFSDLGILKSLVFVEPGPGLGVCGTCAPPAAVGSNEDFAGLEMYVRGGLVNDWGAVLGLNSLSDQGEGVYVARFEAPAGSFEFKVADFDWTLEYCSTTTQTTGVPNALGLFGCPFPSNGLIDIPSPDCYEFTMTTDGAIPPASVDLEFNAAP